MGTLEKKPAGLAATGAWEYASAPESRESVDAPKAWAETKTASADDLFGGLD